MTPFPQLPEPARRALSVVSTIAATFLMITFAMYYAAFARLMYRELHMNDFGKFYYSTQAFFDGQDMYGPTPATEVPVGPAETQQFWNMNPPHLHLLIAPFALLPPLPALVAWALVNLAALVASLTAIFRELRIRWTATRTFWVTFSVLLAAQTGAIVATGQLSFLLMLPMTLAWIAGRNDRWIRAAVWLGVVTSVKPFLAVFGLYFLFTRRWRAAAAMALSGGACFAIGLAVFGAEAHYSWIRTLSKVAWVWAAMNGSVAALFARAFDVSPFFTPFTIAPHVIRPAALVASALILLVGLAVLTRGATVRSVDRAFAGLTLTAQLVSPLGWVYYLCIVTGPMTALLLDPEARRSTSWRIGLAIAAPGLVIPLGYLLGDWVRNPWIGITWGSMYAWTTIGLWFAVLLDRAESRPS